MEQSIEVSLKQDKDLDYIYNCFEAEELILRFGTIPTVNNNNHSFLYLTRCGIKDLMRIIYIPGPRKLYQEVEDKCDKERIVEFDKIESYRNWIKILDSFHFGRVGDSAYYALQNAVEVIESDEEVYTLTFTQHLMRNDLNGLSSTDYVLVREAYNLMVELRTLINKESVFIVYGNLVNEFAFLLNVITGQTKVKKMSFLSEERNYYNASNWAWGNPNSVMDCAVTDVAYVNFFYANRPATDDGSIFDISLIYICTGYVLVPSRAGDNAFPIARTSSWRDTYIIDNTYGFNSCVSGKWFVKPKTWKLIEVFMEHGRVYEYFHFFIRKRITNNERFGI